MELEWTATAHLQCLFRVEDPITILYPSSGLALAFFLCTIICALTVISIWVLWIFRRDNYLLLSMLVTVSMGPLIVASLIDGRKASEENSSDSRLQIEKGRIQFFTDGISTGYTSTEVSHFQLETEQTDNGFNSTISLHLSNGPSFRLQEVFAESPFSNIWAPLQDYRRKLNLPVLDTGLVLDTEKNALLRSANNPYSRARNENRTTRNIFQDSDYPSASRLTANNQGMRIQYSLQERTLSRFALIWFLICLLLTFLFFSVSEFKSHGMDAIRKPSPWLALILIPLIWWLIPSSPSGAVELAINRKGLTMEHKTDSLMISFHEVEYVRCEVPGTGIILYRDNPERILWSEIQKLFPEGPVARSEGPALVALLESGYRSSREALSLYQSSFPIDTGTLSPVERLKLCDLMGHLAHEVRPVW
ncbi:MAG: hypothetical protein RH862_05700 [Leptospiraceae bacterium]